jgi:hypothetical protein
MCQREMARIGDEQWRRAILHPVDFALSAESARQARTG